jgi:hypothetical protein
MIRVDPWRALQTLPPERWWLALLMVAAAGALTLDRLNLDWRTNLPFVLAVSSVIAGSACVGAHLGRLVNILLRPLIPPPRAAPQQPREPAGPAPAG